MVAAWAGALAERGADRLAPAQLNGADETVVRLFAVFHDAERENESDEPTIGTCWDADRMDLPRVGIQPDPQKMSTQEGHDYARLGPVALER